MAMSVALSQHSMAKKRGGTAEETYPATLTLKEAEQFLSMSETHLNNVLDEGLIESIDLNGERAVVRRSAVDFQNEAERRWAFLDWARQEFQDMGLHDD
jgi:hypothetical protein